MGPSAGRAATHRRPADGSDFGAERRSLLCTPWVPWGAHGGAHLRLAMVAEGLSRLGAVDVCVLSPSRPEALELPWPDWVGDAEWCRVEEPPSWRAGALLGRVPPVRYSVLGAQALSAVYARFFSKCHDIVWCAGARGYQPVAELVSAPVVADLYDLVSSYLAHRRRLIGRSPSAALPRGAERDPEYCPALERRWRAWEERTLRACDRVVVCSEVDRRRLGGRAAVVPNCYPQPDRPAGRMRAAGSPLRIGFVGLLGYAPNADAVRWFATDVLPRVRRLEPGAEFVVAGPAGERIRRAARRHGVRMLGAVGDLEQHLAGLSVVVAPIRFGGGTRVKLLEAFAHELPVVTTTVGAEGIEGRDGEHFLVRDDPGGFARAVVGVHRDAQLRARLVAAAHELYETRYSWPRGLAAVEEQVRALVPR